MKAEINTEQKDSITVKKNAKGEYAWDIKRYYDANTTPIDAIIQALVEADEKLHGAF